MRKLFLFALSMVMTLPALALGINHEGRGFPLFSQGRAATVVVSPQESVTVRKVAALLADDVERVTGCKPVVASEVGDTPALVVGTVAGNRYIQQLVAQGRLDDAPIRGGWEQYMIRQVDGRLVIVGSDRRGVAYGVFALSEAIGVSPWYWWADVPVARQQSLFVTSEAVSKAPVVKYRGIFINDEDWGLKPWAATNYERSLADIGPRTYARVCELLLRLRANMLAPAMHDCTGAFYSHPESKLVCDTFGIIITTSHCEPLLLNNAALSEWDQQRDGDWNYKTNRKTIYRKWNRRLSEASRFENIYTVAMRGVHDAGLRGDLPMAERVPLIERVISDQRSLLKKHKRQAPETIPQIFVPYKETMDIYENGLSVPDDITLVWVDDNYGYMKRVGNPEEQQRSGRAGVYYHLSYLGAPHDYLWLNTTPPVLMYEELKKAYNAGADRYWLLNVGDIKPMETGIQTFMDMAWDPESFSLEQAYTCQARMLARLFGYQHEKTFQQLLDDYYRLAWSRKPEYMGFEYEWDDPAHTGLKPTDYSFDHYDEWQQRLADYSRISDLAERMADGSAAYFQLVQFPVQAACQMNRKFLMAQLSGLLLSRGDAAGANWAARQSREAYDSIQTLCNRYNSQLDGKWRGMMDVPPGYCALYQQMPSVTYTEGAGEKAPDLLPRGERPVGCLSVDLRAYDRKTADARLVRGIGYDWLTVQLGSPSADTSRQASVDYSFSSPGADSVTVWVYSVPFWPLYAGLNTAIAISIDGGEKQVTDNRIYEYSRSWKDRVMRNGAIGRLRFAVDKTRALHTIRLTGEAPGQMIERIVIDWGGLQKSYLGPSPARTE